MFLFLVLVDLGLGELVQCRRAAKGCLPPLPNVPQPQYSRNPTNMANIFGPVNRHPAPPCQRGQCPTCQNLPKPCDNACQYKDKYIPLGSSFLPRTTDPCRKGTCTLQNGRYEVKFKHERCSICPKDCIQQPAPGQCCPTCDCGPVQPEYCPPLKECPFLSCPLKDQYTPYQKCCPICDYCVDQWGKETYSNQQQWWYYDQKCTCDQGHIKCETPSAPENPYVGKSCPSPSTTRPHGAEWPDPDDKCKTCECNNGKTICSKRCPSKKCKNGQILGKLRRECCPVCIDNPNTCLAYGRGHLMTIDGNVTNIENCIYTLMSNCKQPTEGGLTDS